MLGPPSASAQYAAMLGMETVAEGMADYFVAHHATMPGSGKTAQAVAAACCLEHSAHASMMTSVPAPRQDDRPRRVRSVTVNALTRTTVGLVMRDAG